MGLLCLQALFLDGETIYNPVAIRIGDCGELGLVHTTQINSPQKNNNLSGIVAFVEEKEMVKSKEKPRVDVENAISKGNEAAGQAKQKIIVH